MLLRSIVISLLAITSFDFSANADFCVCQDEWTSPSDGGDCVNTQYGCPDVDCSTVRHSWCMVVDQNCANNEDGGWAYCEQETYTEPCVCQDEWTSPTDGGNCAQTQFGCPHEDCSSPGKGYNPWCYVVDEKCADHNSSEGGGWALCPRTPSASPSEEPSDIPSEVPSAAPSKAPSGEPTDIPSLKPSSTPSLAPSMDLSDIPSEVPSAAPSKAPSGEPTDIPSLVPSGSPSKSPSSEPSSIPSISPTIISSSTPSLDGSEVPSSVPSGSPSKSPSGEPSTKPTTVPSFQPSKSPTGEPSNKPSPAPTSPTNTPTTAAPITSAPTTAPTAVPTTSVPTTAVPTTAIPTTAVRITIEPTTAVPTSIPTNLPGKFLCKDDETFRVNGQTKKDCEFVIKKNRDARRKKLCSWPTVAEACPVSCGLCCENDDNYTFVSVLNGHTRNCKWLTQSKRRKTKKRRKRNCEQEEVQNKCRKSCGNCESAN